MLVAFLLSKRLLMPLVPADRSLAPITGGAVVAGWEVQEQGCSVHGDGFRCDAGHARGVFETSRPTLAGAACVPGDVRGRCGGLADGAGSARAPDEATTAAFLALYAYDAAWLGSSPPPPPSVAYVTVRWPDGTGSMSVSPRSAAAGSARTFTFTYTAAGHGILAGGQLSLVIPPGWTPPSLTGPAGYITASVFGPPSISGRTITVKLSHRGDQLAPGATLAITYATASAPSSPGTFTFSASQQTADPER